VANAAPKKFDLGAVLAHEAPVAAPPLSRSSSVYP
jgi:hypothetical protein